MGISSGEKMREGIWREIAEIKDHLRGEDNTYTTH